MSEKEKNVIKVEDVQEITPEQVLYRVNQKLQKLANTPFISAVQENCKKKDVARMEELIRFYEDGLNRRIPKEWGPIAIELDPEYQEFLRLEKKFGKDRVNRSRSL